MTIIALTRWTLYLKVSFLVYSDLGMYFKVIVPWTLPDFFLCMHVYMLSHVRLCATPWTVAHQPPLFMGFFRQEFWSGLPFPSPGDLPNPGIEPVSLMSPALAGGFFTIVPPDIFTNVHRITVMVKRNHHSPFFSN